VTRIGESPSDGSVRVRDSGPWFLVSCKNNGYNSPVKAPVRTSVLPRAQSPESYFPSAFNPAGGITACIEWFTNFRDLNFQPSGVFA
jgi:hypothetical protein